MDWKMARCGTEIDWYRRQHIVVEKVPRVTMRGVERGLCMMGGMMSEKLRNQGGKGDEDRSESADEVVEISNAGDEVEVVVDPESQSGTGAEEIT